MIPFSMWFDKYRNLFFRHSGLPLFLCAILLLFSVFYAQGEAKGRAVENREIRQKAAFIQDTPPNRYSGFLHHPVAAFTELESLSVVGGGFLISLGFLAFTLFPRRSVNRIKTPGFEIITPTEKRSFVPLGDKNHHMDFLNQIKTKGSLRLSANLNKVNLSVRRYGYLLEDKNFRNALLVNRRRIRRTLLRDGDVLDLGDLTLLYRDNRPAPSPKNLSASTAEGKVIVKFDRPRGPARKGLPVLVPVNNPNRKFFMTKNMISVGRSEINDLVIKSPAIEFRHAKIERVGQRFKLVDLTGLGRTYVNNRRVEQWFLKEGDEISLENHKFKYQLLTKHTKPQGMERPSRGETPQRDGSAFTEGSSQFDSGDLDD